MSTERDSLIGLEVDGYLIETPIDEEGMARVYRAYDARLARYVAFKAIEPLWAIIDSEYTQRFEKEARAIAQLQHPHIVTVYRFGKVVNLHYMAMQYVDGADLAWILDDYARRGELMPHEDIQRIIAEIASALDYAHSKGVLHRDVRPANLMLDQDGHAFLTNFGLSLVQSEDTLAETSSLPYYVAPEQAMNLEEAVPQSDQYSLGIMIFQMLTGKLPFQSKSPADVALAHMNELPPSPRQYNRDLHPAFSTVLGGALEKKPQHRYPTCSALASDLETILKLQMEQPAVPARLSKLSIADRVGTFRDEHPIPAAPTIPIATKVQTVPETEPDEQPTLPIQPKRRRWKWAELAAAVVVEIMVAVTAFFIITLLRTASNTSPPPVTPVLSPLPAATLALVASPFPTLSPSIAATPFVSDGLPVRFLYDANAFYWMNDSSETINAAAITFERVNGTEHFEGSRFAYFFMEPGRCMQIMFADVALIGCPESRRPNAYFTPTRTQGVDFWTGSGQFRVLWNGIEIAVCDISAGQCRANIPTE
jgi:serine/threonine protein kinase